MLARMLLALALASSAGCPGDECDPGWAPVFEDLPAPVLAAAAGDAGDVFVVGGGLGVAGIDAVARRWDGDGWTVLETDRSETLWWAWADTSTNVWMVGENGLVLRWDGASFETIASGTTATLYGVWGTGPDDVWIVGGTVGSAAGAPKDVLLHWDGATLSADTTLPARGAVLFKVWGSGPNDVWISGDGGTILHYDGTSWRDDSGAAGVADSLLTIHGCSATEVYTVGGRSLLRFDGSAWARVDGVDLTSFANGVSCGADAVLVTGNGGLKLRLDRTAGTWVNETFDRPWDTDFHGALVAPSGQLWAVGGNFLTPPSANHRVGVIGAAGCPRP